MKEAISILPSASENISSTLTPERVIPVVQNAEMPLSEDERQERIGALREWSREYFEEQYPKLRVTDFFTECERLGLMRTKEATGDEERDQKRILEEALSGRFVNVEALPKQMTPQPKPGMESGTASVFFEELIDFAISKERAESDSLERYGSNIESTALHSLGHTWKASGLTISEEVRLATRSAESPLLRRHLFPSLACEAAARLGEAEEREVIRIAADLSQEEPGTALSLIRTFSALAEAAAFDENERQSLDRMGVILRTIAESDIAVVRFAALHAVDSLAPTAEARRAYRPIERVKEIVMTPEKKRETDRLTRTIIRSTSDTADESTVARIASDAIAFRGRDSSAHAICIVPAEVLDHLEDIGSSRDWKSIRVLRNILESDRRGRLTRKETGQVVSDLAKYLFDDGALADTEGLSRTFSSLSDALTQTQWKGLLDDTARIRHCYAMTWKERDQVDERYAAEEKRRGKDILIQVTDMAETGSGGRRDISDSVIDLAGKLREALTTDDVDSGIEYLEQWLEETPEIDGSFRKTVSEKLRSFWKTNADAIEREFRDKQEAESAVRKHLDISEIEKRGEETLGYLAEEASGFRNDALAYVQARIDQAKNEGDLLLVTPESYETLLSRQELAPFRRPNVEDVRLLQNLHAPEGTGFLGMDFSRLPLRAQVHFLSFRGREDTAAAERFRLVLEKHPSLNDDLAYSFLATAEGGEYGETLLSLAERLDTETLGPILKKYVEITKDTDSVTDYVRKSFPNLEAAEVEREALAISKNLLRRGRDLLVEFSKQTDTDSETLLRRLDDVNTSVELYKKTFRALREAGVVRDLSEMAGTVIDVLAPEDLSEADKAWTRDLYRRSYPEPAYSETHRATLFAKLEKRIADREHDTRFYIFRGAGKNAGFMIFENGIPTEEGRPTRYGSSFNSEAKFLSDATDTVTSAFADAILKREGESAVIELDSDPMNRVSEFYLRRYGFVGIRTEMIGDAERIRMRRYPDAAERPLSSRVPLTAEAAVNAVREGHPFGFIEHVRLSDRAKLIGTIRDMTARGYVLTAISPERGGSGTVAVFENPSLRKAVVRMPEELPTADAA